MDPGRLRFGLFEFDCATRELRREGVLLRLQPQPALVLACLLANRGEVVSREALREKIWGPETHVDFERGLNFCMAQIRAAVDDDAANPRFVRTIPKRGYQFIAPVEEVGEDTSHAAGEIAQGRRPWKRLVVLASVLLIAAAVGAGAGGYWLRANRGPARTPIVAVVRFDDQTDGLAAGLADEITDNVVAEITVRGQGRYRVIGNARVLRASRAQRDLSLIARELQANYVVLGQVQRNGSGIRVLAHLIRMPEQTHIWVDRMDGSGEAGSKAGLDFAASIAADFSPRIASDASGSRLPEFPNH